MRQYDRPEATLSRAPQDSHHLDWLQAIREGRKAGSDFAYGGPLTEIGLLGAIAVKFPGTKLQWDSANMRFTNMCTVSYAGMKGFSERTFAVTNSPKTRNYFPSCRYLKDDALVEVICTGKIPKDA